MLEPEGYTFLAACRENEGAKERLFEDKTYGVLTRLLMDAPEKYDNPALQPTYDMLHRGFLLKEIKKYSSQTAILGSERDRSFFGRERLQPFTRHRLPVSPKDAKVGNVVELNVGEAHGISREEEFDV